MISSSNARLRRTAAATLRGEEFPALSGQLAAAPDRRRYARGRRAPARARIFIELAQRPRQEGEFFAREVIGLKVRTLAGEELGELTEILVTGANDVYVVKGRAARYCACARGSNQRD